MFRGVLDSISPLAKAADEAVSRSSQQVLVGRSDLLSDMVDASSESCSGGGGTEAIQGLPGSEEDNSA
jgi:hypothetical protein